MANDAHDNAETDKEMLARVTKKQTRRPRAKKVKLCVHGFPSIPDPRGCATCWNKHPGFVKAKPIVHPAPDMSHAITCEKCFLPSQRGFPPLRRVPDSKPAVYTHLLCPPDVNAGPMPERRIMRGLRRTLRRSLRRHMRKMIHIQKARHERGVILRMAEARLTRAVIAAAEERDRDQAVSTG